MKFINSAELSQEMRGAQLALFSLPNKRRHLPFHFYACSRNALIHNVDVSLVEIKQAEQRIRDFIYFSPCQLSDALSEVTGQQVFLKLDNLQRTGAFKERGALNRILLLSEDEKRRGVIAASAGNHAQAVAYHASQRGVLARIVMPQPTPLVKVSATRGFGAEVILHGANYDEACDEATRLQQAEQLTFIHPFDDDEVIAGQGTIGLEVLEQLPDVEAIVVPIGGGGLIGGVACAVKEARPDVRRAGERTFPLVQRYVDEIVTVDEEEISSAILVLLEKEKTLAEGAGAAALAALLQGKTGLRVEKTVALVCGGNIDVTLLSRIIERGLAKDGRLLRIRVYLLDRPGSLHQLTRILTECEANIVQTSHNRSYYGVNLGDTVIEITLETRGSAHIAAIADALTAAGYRHERVH